MMYLKIILMLNFCQARLRVSKTWLLQFLFGVCACISASIRICPDHNLYNNARISKQFGTVVALEEEKCPLKHFLRYVEGQSHRGQIEVKMVIY